jgi:hypothetical protein
LRRVLAPSPDVALRLCHVILLMHVARLLVDSQVDTVDSRSSGGSRSGGSQSVLRAELVQKQQL